MIENKNDKTVELSSEEPINLDNFLKILAKSCNFKTYEKDKVFFKNDYLMK